ncbi:MAG: hypothetical protein INR71_13760, partial [Terriglobus roseus]|nr:hypothetical protein [Terriglobus roseus]
MVQWPSRSPPAPSHSAKVSPVRPGRRVETRLAIRKAAAALIKDDGITLISERYEEWQRCGIWPTATAFPPPIARLDHSRLSQI